MNTNFKCLYCNMEYDMQSEVYTNFCSNECYQQYIYQLEKFKNKDTSRLEHWDWS